MTADVARQPSVGAHRPPALVCLTTHWLQGTDDQFAEKSLGFRINALTGVLAIPGLLIMVVAVPTVL